MEVGGGTAGDDVVLAAGAILDHGDGEALQRGSVELEVGGGSGYGAEESLVSATAPISSLVLWLPSPTVIFTSTAFIVFHLLPLLIHPHRPPLPTVATQCCIRPCSFHINFSFLRYGFIFIILNLI